MEGVPTNDDDSDQEQQQMMMEMKRKMMNSFTAPKELMEPEGIINKGQQQEGRNGNMIEDDDVLELHRGKLSIMRASISSVD